MKLSTYLADNEIKLADFGRRIERSAATVSRLARGVQKPDWDTVEAIHRETSGLVTANDFMAETEAPDAAA